MSCPSHRWPLALPPKGLVVGADGDEAVGSDAAIKWEAYDPARPLVPVKKEHPIPAGFNFVLVGHLAARKR